MSSDPPPTKPTTRPEDSSPITSPNAIPPPPDSDAELPRSDAPTSGPLEPLDLARSEEAPLPPSLLLGQQPLVFPSGPKIQEFRSSPTNAIRLASREGESEPPGAIRFQTAEEFHSSIPADPGSERAPETLSPVSRGFTRRNSLLPAPATREALDGLSLNPSAPESNRVRVAPPGFQLPYDETHGGVVHTLRATISALRDMEMAQVFQQMDQLGLRSFGFVGLVLGFVGCILVYQAGIQALRIVPDTSTIGPSYIEILVRDLAASLTALMLATRVGAGIAAELGSMRVTDQLDAYRLSRADPVVFLVAPRIVASVVMTPLLTFFGGGVALITGTLTGVWAFDINPNVFLDMKFVDGADLGAGVLKSISFGLAIPLFSAHAGLYTKGGSQGVGNATTRAVVNSSLAVIILGFVIGAFAEILFGGAPE